MTGKVYTSIDPAPLARVVVIALWVDLAMSAVYGLSSLLSVADIAAADPTAPKDTPLPNDLLVGGVAMLMLATSAVAGFLILKWIYRVNRNAHSMVRGLSISPPWAVGWFFVPIAYLWKPYQAMRDTWRASARRASGIRGEPIPSMLRWWWGLWLASSILGSVSFRVYMSAQTLSGAGVSAWVDVVTALVAIPLDLIFIRVVRELTQLQVTALTYGIFDDEPDPLSAAARGGGIVGAEGG